MASAGGGSSHPRASTPAQRAPPGSYSTRPSARRAMSQHSVAALTATIGSCGSARRTAAMRASAPGTSALLSASRMGKRTCVCVGVRGWGTECGCGSAEDGGVERGA
eukprot:71522-Chlamydomonas_euryale.AAC.1